MIDGNIHTQTERYGAVELQWTNHVDASGSRIEWQISTDSQGWTCSYGPVHNAGLMFGSRAVSQQSDSQTLLMALRQQAASLAGLPVLDPLQTQLAA
ncbi:hypothetical protein GN316_03275 [Xylophilus sp. Kf1]|nr:hypothetical protein [Xylophilus sp. Kf1]